MKKIGIIGTRRRDSRRDFRIVQKKFLEIYEEEDMIISGGCPKGGDQFAYELAKKHGIPILIYFPDWESFGKAAGFARNSTIAMESMVLIACVADDRKGGTEDTIKKFERCHTKRYLKNNLHIV